MTSESKNSEEILPRIYEAVKYDGDKFKFLHEIKQSYQARALVLCKQVDKGFPKSTFGVVS